ncbi:MAG: cytochrome c [Myxococcales bacterium]|nr:cytochrome c [Myxococcales bacterium]
MRWITVLLPVIWMACETGEYPFEPATESGDRVQRVGDIEGDPTFGRQVYADQCQACHREDGITGLGPDLPGYVSGAAPIDVINIVIEGQGRMTAMGTAMNDQQIADLVAWLFEEWGPDTL